jgi:hypothetical protein
MNARRLEFIDHESYDLLGTFGNHADAVALPQAVDEFLLGPWIFEASRFDVEYRLEISTNQPPDVYRLLCICRLGHRSDSFRIPSRLPFSKTLR